MIKVSHYKEDLQKRTIWRNESERTIYCDMTSALKYYTELVDMYKYVICS